MPNNIPEDNVFSTVFGYCKNGTSWLVDVAVTTTVVIVFLVFADWLIPDVIQQAVPIITNALIIVPASILSVYVWRRASADNRRRKADAEKASK